IEVATFRLYDKIGVAGLALVNLVEVEELTEPLPSHLEDPNGNYARRTRAFFETTSEMHTRMLVREGVFAHEDEVQNFYNPDEADLLPASRNKNNYVGGGGTSRSIRAGRGGGTSVLEQ
ncbi:unnamed protein product, partial [Amoebophrya sp. A25]